MRLSGLSPEVSGKHRTNRPDGHTRAHKGTGQMSVRFLSALPCPVSGSCPVAQPVDKYGVDCSVESAAALNLARVRAFAQGVPA